MVKITGFPSKGASAEKGEPKTVRSAQRWFYDLQVLETLTNRSGPVWIRRSVVRGVWDWIINAQGGERWHGIWTCKGEL